MNAYGPIPSPSPCDGRRRARSVRFTSPSWPVRTSPAEPGIDAASTNSTSPPDRSPPDRWRRPGRGSPRPRRKALPPEDVANSLSRTSAPTSPAAKPVATFRGACPSSRSSTPVRRASVARARARRAAPQGRDRSPPARAGADRPRRDAVRDALGRRRFHQEAADVPRCPGVATGLAVTGPVATCCSSRRRDDGEAGLAHRPARRRDEGVGADRALLRQRARDELGIEPTARPTRSTSRPRGRDPQGRAVGRHHDDHRVVSLLTGGRCGQRSA